VSARAAARRGQPPLLVRLRALWVMAILALVALTCAFVAFANAPQLRVRSVDVTLPPNAPVSRDAILAAAAIPPDANVVLLGAGGVAKRIEAIPYVDRARVRRALYPQPLVRLEVTLRAPYACVTTGGSTATIDGEARVVQAGCAPGPLPSLDLGQSAAPAPGSRLDDPETTRLMADLATILTRFPVRSLRRDRFGGLEAVDAGGLLLRFGDDRDLAQKLALVAPIRQAEHGRRLRAIDLRAPSTPVVQFP
jgi:hypothetical protein